MKPTSAFYAFMGLLLLQMVCLELHELGHHITGRMICGCWGTRDFYNWALCSGCESKPSAMLATLAGPIINIILCWVSVLYLISSDPVKKSIGLYLLFANLPIIRWLAVADGGGDEFVALKYYWGNTLTWYSLRAFAFAIESILILPPLFVAYKNIHGRWKPFWFVLLCFIPGFFMQPMQNSCNDLLAKGVLPYKIFMKIPLLINLVFVLCLYLIWILRKRMYQAAFFLTSKK